MKRRILSMLLVTVAVVLAACSSATEPEASCTLEDDLALQTGNWWVYDVYETDTTNNKIAGTERRDSTVVERTELHNGKTTYVLVNYSTVDEGISYTATDTTWIAMEGAQAYMPMWNLTPTYCSCFAEDRVLFADCSRDSWTAFELTRMETIPMLLTFSGRDSVAQVQNQTQYRTNVNKATSAAVVLEGRSISTQEFQVSHRFESTLIDPIDATYFTGGRTLTGVETIRLVLGENIGIVAMERTAQQILEAPEPYSDDMKGVAKHLLRYSVK